MQGYDIQGNGLRLGQFRNGALPISRLQGAGACAGLVGGLLVVALGNLTGWPILVWAIVPTIVGGIIGTQVLGVSLVGHGWHAAHYLLAHRGWTQPGVVGERAGVGTEPPITCALVDGDRVVWQVAVPNAVWERS